MPEDLIFIVFKCQSQYEGPTYITLDGYGVWQYCTINQEGATFFFIFSLFTFWKRRKVEESDLQLV